MGKRFSPELYKQYDNSAKVAGFEFLRPFARKVAIPMDRFSCDLEWQGWDDEGEDPSVKLLECEVKAVWAGGAFPYEDIQILGRKRKYFDQGAAILLMAANLQDGIWLSAETVLSSPTSLVKNKYNWNGEEFFKVAIRPDCLIKLKAPCLNKRLPTCNECGRFDVELINNKWSCRPCAN